MTTPTTQDLLCFNGVNGATGEYDLPPMTGEEFFDFLRGAGKPENLNELRFRYLSRTQQHLGVVEGVDPKKLEEAGWGIIFTHTIDPAIREALTPLIEHRRQQAGQFCQVYEKEKAYRPGESKQKFLARHGAGPGPADPAVVPYYLLIVGSPQEIDYRFQCELDVQYAVGRIHFATPQEYANYAASVVAAETKGVKLPRQVTFFGVANEADKATTLSTEQLITPLHQKLSAKYTDWQFNTLLRDQATKANLAHLLGGKQTPALLFTGSHGMGFPNGDARQLAHQGALLCQDWPGPAWKQPIPQDHYFAGDDLTSDANLLGSLAFFFACYGAGTPELDEFAKQAFKKERAPIAPYPFLAQLPTKMLSQEKGGALAVIGHVERAWGYSFVWPEVDKPQTGVFESALRRLLEGHPVGSAFEYFNERHAELSVEVANELQEVDFGKVADPYAMASMWTANNDARGYAIIGDPAVRLAVAKEGEQEAVRPTIEVKSPLTTTTEAATQEPASSDGASTGFEVEASTPVMAQPAEPGSAPDAPMITIATYLANDMAHQDAANLVALTEIMPGGSIKTTVAKELAKGDERYLTLHQQTVSEAVKLRLAAVHDTSVQRNPQA